MGLDAICLTDSLTDVCIIAASYKQTSANRPKLSLSTFSVIYQNENKALEKKKKNAPSVIAWLDSPLHPLSLSLSRCASLCLFFLEANCDWLIKTITEITKSNQVWTLASYRYADHLEYALNGFGIRPNAAD